MSEGPWEVIIGVRPYAVTAYENVQRGGRVYLKWWSRTIDNWEVRSLKRKVRTDGGRLIKHVVEWAKAEAKKQHENLVNGIRPEERPTAQLTIGGTTALLIDPERGKYPKDSPHRREVLREVAIAAKVWGADRTWNSIRRQDMRVLRRKRMQMLAAKGAVGFRGTQITVSRILTVADWLRSEEYIDDVAALPETEWKEELKKELDAPEPKRLRYTPEEAIKLIQGAPAIDPRLGLMVALGAELRLGQVRRCRRSALDLEKGLFTVMGKGKKRGAIVHLTPGQLASAKAAVTTGYLRDLEANGGDFPLFPGTQLVGNRKHGGAAGVAHERHANAAILGARIIDRWWKRLEKSQGIAHLKGRGFYGIRRVQVDQAVAEGISKDGLKEHGGWADTQVPERIYREQERTTARVEAMKVRAKIRGETQ